MKMTVWALLGMMAAMTSCAPKATVVAETPPVKKEPAPPVAVVQETALPTPADDGLRMPDMLAMPDEGDFRSTGGAKPGTQSGAVIARPPTDPPARVKPKAE